MSLQFDNVRLLEQVNEALVTNGHKAVVNHRQISDRTLLVRVRFDETENLAGEKFSKQLYLLNVNDGRHALKMICGLYRFACTNGLVIPAYEGSANALRIVHRDCRPTQEKLRALPDLIAAGIEAITYGATDMINEAQEIEIATPEQAIQVIGNLGVADRVKDFAVRKWYNRSRPEDTPNNAWSLYNIVNEGLRLTHGEFTRVGIQANQSLYQDVITLATDVVGGKAA